MKKLVLPFFLLTAFAGTAQTVHRCYSKEAVDYQQSLMPDYQQRVNEQFEIAKQWAQTHEPTRDLYVIPVVFHVVYNTPEENIPDAVLQNQIDIMNEDYARMNADTVNLRSEFSTIAGPTNVRFVMATLDPDGNPTNGITRTSTTVETFGTFTLDFAELEKVKSTADGGIDAWDQAHYLNIWVCDMSIDFLGTPLVLLLGYATPPDGLPNWPSDPQTESLGDGVVLQYNVVGDAAHNPQAAAASLPDSKGRTAVHEVGHYLGLRHIWGDGDCTQDDGVDDTPDATDASQQDCDITKNTCNADVVGLGDLPDMVENFMDYSAESCQNSFTRHQTDLMHGVLENERYDLVHNNSAAGIEKTTYASLSVYPNPSENMVTISSAFKMKNLSVTDLKGRTLMTQEVNANVSNLSLASLDAGVYVVTIILENGKTRHQKIIKK